MITPTKCSLCDSPLKAHGLCSRHYQSLLRYGTPEGHDRPYWTEKELRHLNDILDRSEDGLGYALPGELVHLAFIIDRSCHALRSKLHELRAVRKAEQNRALT